MQTARVQARASSFAALDRMLPSIAFALLSIACILLSACNGSSSSKILHSVHVQHKSERALHNSGEPASFEDFVVLRLESSGSHAGDIGEAGSDSFTIALKEAGRNFFQIAAEDAGLYEVRLSDSDGNILIDLNSGNLSASMPLSNEEYTLSVTRTDSGELPIAVFFHRGKFSRSCQNCNLSAVELIETDLSSVSFHGSDLQGAVLAGVQCAHTDFSDTNLQGAMLSGANCPEANFSNSNITGLAVIGVNLDGVELTEEQIASIGQLDSQKDTGSAQTKRAINFSGRLAFTAAQDIVISAGQPLIINNSGSPTNLAYGTMTLQSGGYIQVYGPTNINVQSLVAESGSFISIVGANGASGSDGARGVDGLAEVIPDGSPGQAGGDGQDGYTSPVFYLSAGSIQGPVVVRVNPGQGGRGGAGGRGGNGASSSVASQVGNGGSGGSGGQGARGGDEGTVYITYRSLSGASLSRQTGQGYGGSGGPGGAGGNGGQNTSGSGPNGASGWPGNAGSAGTPGNPGNVVFVQSY